MSVMMELKISLKTAIISMVKDLKKNTSLKREINDIKKRPKNV